MQSLITKTINLKEGNREKKAEIRDYFLKTWQIDEKLYTQLADDDTFYMRGDPLDVCHPFLSGAHPKAASL